MGKKHFCFFQTTTLGLPPKAVTAYWKRMILDQNDITPDSLNTGDTMFCKATTPSVSSAFATQVDDKMVEFGLKRFNPTQ